jgi:hypothetical protein
MIGIFEDLTLPPALKAPLPLLDFKLTPAQEAAAPAETRGLRRPVRLMVSFCHNHQVVHNRFDQLTGFLHAGDVLVINTSATLKAALKVRRLDGTEMELHLSTRLPGKRWVVEIRQPVETGGEPFYSAEQGERLSLLAVVWPYSPFLKMPCTSACGQPPCSFQKQVPGEYGLSVVICANHRRSILSKRLR